jgi:hypothetical protein
VLFQQHCARSAHCTQLASYDAGVCRFLQRFGDPLRAVLCFAIPSAPQVFCGFAIAFADNFLQKQQKQRERRFGEGRCAHPAGPPLGGKAAAVTAISPYFFAPEVAIENIGDINVTSCV